MLTGSAPPIKTPHLELTLGLAQAVVSSTLQYDRAHQHPSWVQDVHCRGTAGLLDAGLCADLLRARVSSLTLCVLADGRQSHRRPCTEPGAKHTSSSKHGQYGMFWLSWALRMLRNASHRLIFCIMAQLVKRLSRIYRPQTAQMARCSLESTTQWMHLKMRTTHCPPHRICLSLRLHIT